MTRYPRFPGTRFTLVEALVVISIIATLVAITFRSVGVVGWSNEAKTIEVLEASGYTDIEITGWRPWMANQGDWYSTGFTAKGPSGKPVSGAVTGGGLFRGYTVRLD